MSIGTSTDRRLTTGRVMAADIGQAVAGTGPAMVAAIAPAAADIAGEVTAEATEVVAAIGAEAAGATADRPDRNRRIA
jgi:hypothetical protein